MPFYTEKFNLPFFSRGEIYSASKDRKRFEIIDEELSYLSSLIGSGVVNGLEVIKISNSQVQVKSGLFCIDGKMYSNSVDQILEVGSVGSNYVRINNGSSNALIFGRSSNIAEISYTDTGIDALIENVEFESITPYSVKINIISLLPADSKKIRAYRSIDNSFNSAVPIAAIDYPSVEFNDEEINAGTNYYYWFTIEDINGFVSEVSSSFLYTSPSDLSIPDVPSSLKCFPAHRSICVNWKHSFSKNIDYYYLTLVQSGIVQERVVPKNINHVIFSNLKNGIACNISIKAISAFGIESSEATISAVPSFHPGARDADSIYGVFSPAVVENTVRSFIDITWSDPVIDPSLQDLSVGELKELEGFVVSVRYQVWELRVNGTFSIQGEPTEAFIPNQIRFSSYTRKNSQNQIVNEPLKDNTSYLIKLTRVVNGMESVGRYITVGTGDVTPPSKAFNISGSLQNDSTILFTWSVDKISEILKQKVIVKSAPIISTTYNYAGSTSTGIRFESITSTGAQSGTAISAIFEEDPPFKIGFTGSYITCKIDKERIQSLNNSASVAGFSSVSIDILSASEDILISTENKNLVDVIEEFNSIPAVLKITFIPGSGFSKSLLVTPAQCFEIQNASSYSDEEILFDRLLPSEPANFTPGVAEGYGDAISYTRELLLLNSGLSISDIQKNVTVGEYQLQISEEIGNSTSYVLPYSYVVPDRRYHIAVSLYDFSGNESAIAEYYFDTPSPWQIDPETSPMMQVASAQDGFLKVSWIPSPSQYVSQYKVYRINIGLTDSLSFQNERNAIWDYVGHVDSSDHEFIDYSVIPGNYYIYRVVTVGLLGQVSPIFFGLMENDSTTSVKRANKLTGEEFTPSISIAQNNNDILVSVNTQSGDFDGFQIYRSFNMEEFKLIGSLSTGEYQFLDRGALLKSGSYRYLAIPVTTQSSLIITNDENISDGILLAEVVLGLNSLDIIDRRSSVLLGSSAVTPELNKKISDHRHFAYSEDVDMRVSLSDEYVFTSFNSDNYQRFFIIDRIPKLPNNFEVVVLLNSEVSSINYEFLPDRKLLKFASQLAPLEGQEKTTQLFDSLPDIKLIIYCDGEVGGDLSKDRLSSVFAQQISSGKIKPNSIPDINHSGIYGEKMSALDCIAESVDGFKFLVTRNENRNYLLFNQQNNTLSEMSDFEFNDLELSDGFLSKVGFPLNKTRHYLVYDAFNIPGTENFIFSTSRGVYYYWQNGDSFSTSLIVSSEPPQDSGPCHKIVYMPISKSIYCLNFRSFDILKVSANGGIALTYAQQALNFNAHVFRDAVELNDGTVFISSDIGVFRVKTSDNVNYQSNNESFFGDVANIKIDQIGFFSGSSTEIYGMWTDDSGSVVYISTEFGIFYSTDKGDLFVKDTALRKTPILYHIIKYQSVLFAVGESGIYRKRTNENEFKRIFYDDTFSFKRIVVKYGKLLVTTNDGVYASESLVKCKYNESVSLYPIDLENAESGLRKLVYSLVPFGPYLVACLEGKTKIIYNLDRYADHVDFSSTITIFGHDDFPTVTVNGKPENIHVYFQYNSDGTKNDCLFFDKFIDQEKSVRVIRQYASFKLPSGGWARRDFAATCILYKNNSDLNEGSRAHKPFNQLAYYADISHALNDKVANIVSVESGIEDIKSHALYMMTNTVDNDGNITELGVHRFTRNNIRIMIDKIDQVNANIYDDTDASNMGILSSLRLPYMNLQVDFISNVLPSPYGVSVERLNELGIISQSYSEPSYTGTLGTYDPEDPNYLLPNIPLTTPIDGTDEPNYEISDEDAFSDSLEVPYSGYYGSNNAGVAGFSWIGGRNRPSGTVEPPEGGDFGCRYNCDDDSGGSGPGGGGLG